MFWRTLGRLILIPIALIIAAVTALGVALTLGLEKVTHAMHGTREGLDTIEAYTNLAFQSWDLLAGLSILPMLAVVIIGEVARIRSWLYYMIGGGVSLAVLPLLARIGQSGVEAAATAPPATLWQVLATAGFVGGLVYWLIAGRTA
ncbi:MAG: hypothetical protein ACT4N2_01965 [Hyphomicrobium sp.]